MTYTETISELINGNTQDCNDELEDIKRAIGILEKRVAENTREKVDSLCHKIEIWDCDDKAYDLMCWLNELCELENDVPYSKHYLPKSLLPTKIWHRDLYNRLDSILEIYACDINENILFRDDDGKFIVENIDSLGEKRLTLKDKREVSHQLIDKMSEEELNKVLITSLFEED